MFYGWLFLYYPYYSYTYPHTTRLSVYECLFMLELLNILNNQLRNFYKIHKFLHMLSRSYNWFIDSIGFSVNNSSKLCT